MTENVFLHGVALANFRGIGNETQFIGPFSRFNFLIGPNNAGKSSVLGFIAEYLNPMVFGEQGRQQRALDAFDRPVAGNTGAVLMGVGVPTSMVRDKVLKAYSGQKLTPTTLTVLEELLDRMSDQGMLWLERKQLKLAGIKKDAQIEELAKGADRDAWYEAWRNLTSAHGGDLRNHWIPGVLEIVMRHSEVPPPKINLIPAIRQISPKGKDFSDWSGTGLIEELARLQNPGPLEQAKRQSFKRINQFLKSVTENETAEVEIPHDRENVLIHMDGKILPLKSLGTGIHEVVMLAAFCTLMKQEIVCIEEPEIHLHPLLQRRLIQYLQEQTDNQYFIATHSASIIDTSGAAVFHVTNRNKHTEIVPALTPNSRFSICRDLGYKASDLLQANAILWVEGPSDRIYLRHWISLLAPELREGIDYSIMFYGGRLLSHLSADDTGVAEEDLEALIAVRQLNRNLAVIMDSDKKNAADTINATKTRILEELETHGGVGWLTQGREIENYVPTNVMSAALGEVYKTKYEKRAKSGQFDHVLPFKTNDGMTFKEVDKVKVAKAACARIDDLNVLDLKDRIDTLVGMIRAANTHS